MPSASRDRRTSGQCPRAVSHFGGPRLREWPIRRRQERPQANHATDGLRPRGSEVTAAVEVVAPARRARAYRKVAFRRGGAVRDGRPVASWHGAWRARPPSGLRFGRGSARVTEAAGPAIRLEPGHGRASAQRWAGKSRSAARYGSNDPGERQVAGFGPPQVEHPGGRDAGTDGVSGPSAEDASVSPGQGAGGQANRAGCAEPTAGNHGRKPEGSGGRDRELRDGRRKDATGCCWQKQSSARPVASSGLRPVLRGKVGSCGTAGEG
jgi:hypothetical protein